jgi:hypothetical protein
LLHCLSAGTSSGQYDNDGVAATLCSMNGPQNLAVDYNGDLYIADLYNMRIRKVSKELVLANSVVLILCWCALAGGLFHRNYEHRCRR